MCRIPLIILTLSFLLTCIMKNNLHSNLENWKSLGASDTVLSWIEHGVKFPLIGDISSFELPNGNFSAKQETFLNSEINNLLLLGCIERVPSKPKCVSPISCVPKKNGKFRLVTDLRHINTHSQPPKVKYDDINTVISVVKPKDYIVTTDLQNVFFHVPVHIDHQTLLGFKFKSHYYIWTVLPFGHNCSPFFFSKILRPVVSYLRSRGLRLVLYVDDFVLFAPRDAIFEHKQLLLTTLEQLGWIVNFEKSSLEPTLVKEFIGYLIDNTGVKSVIKIPRKRITKVR